MIGLAEDRRGGVRGRGGLQVEPFRFQPPFDFHARSYPPALGLFEGELQSCLKNVIKIIVTGTQYVHKIDNNMAAEWLIR